MAIIFISVEYEVTEIFRIGEFKFIFLEIGPDDKEHPSSLFDTKIR